MSSCININHPDFKKLKQETGFSDEFLSAKVSVWMEQNNSSKIPTAFEIGIDINDIKIPFAVYGVAKFPDGSYAGVSYPKENAILKDKTSLPGGEIIQRSKNPKENLSSLSKEQGWQVKKVGKEIERKYVDGKPVFYYEMEVEEKPLADFKQINTLVPTRIQQSQFEKEDFKESSVKKIAEKGIKPKFYIEPETVIVTKTVFSPEKYEKEYKNVDLSFDLEEKLLEALKEINEKGKGVNIVGGAVRDSLQGATPKDIDFEVFGLTTEELKEILQKYGEVSEQGKAFGVIVLRTEKDTYEFALPRKDIKTGEGYKGFEVQINPNATVEEAAKRRDFTWNSMSYNPIIKTLYDPYNGLEDLQNGIIRHVDSQTFSEDPLRILRAMQFQARMGHRIAPETKKLMKKIVENGELSTLSKERFITEWRKWAVKGKYHSLIFSFLRDTGLEEFYPEFKKLRETPQDEVYHPEGNVEEHTMQVLAKAKEIADRENLDDKEREILIFSALLHDIAKPETTEKIWSERDQRYKITARGHEAAGVEPAEKFLKKIGLRKDDIEVIKPIIREHLAHASISSITSEKGKMSAFSKLVERLKPAKINQLLLLMEADMMGRNNSNVQTPLTIEEFKKLQEEYIKKNKGDKFKPLITGKHLLERGMEQGPELGRIVKEAKEAQLNTEFETIEEAEEWLNKRLENTTYTKKVEKPQEVKVFESELEKRLLRFLKALKIDVAVGQKADEILENLNFKKKPLAAFDVLNKFLAFSTGNENLLPEQVAYIMYTFLGKKSTLSKSLWIHIKKWEKYDALYNFYKKATFEPDEEGFTGEEEYMDDESFNPFAHRLVIIRFLEESLNKVFFEGEAAKKKRINQDVSKEFFSDKGRLNPYVGSYLEKLFAKIYNWFMDLIHGKVFEEFDSQSIIDLGLDIAEDVIKGNFEKFTRGYVEKDGKVYSSDGEELFFKTYEETLNSDPFAKEIVQKLFNNPFLNYKLSGSITIKRYGRVLRQASESLHDIDGVIPLETFLKEESAMSFKNWIREKGLYYTFVEKSPKRFYKEIKPLIEKMTWYKNVLYEFPGFQMTGAFIGRDRKKGESITIQGYIEHPTEMEMDKDTGKLRKKRYSLDFFLRIDEGNYPEIFNSYWKDWKQIFEAKINMGRAKDIFDLIYFKPHKEEDRYKFTNKGFRFFSFDDKNYPDIKLNIKTEMCN